MISSSFAGFVANNEAGHSLLKDVRTLLKGKNVCVRIFGRNQNRRQFAKAARCNRAQLRQNLPLKYATHYGVYIYKNHKVNSSFDPSNILDAKIVFDTVRKIYEIHGVKITP